MKSLRICLKNSKGISLIEGVLGIAILAASSMGVMKLSKQSANNKNRIIAEFDHINLRKKIRLLLSNPMACDASVQGIQFRGSNMPTSPTPFDQLNPGNAGNPLHSLKLKYMLSDRTPGSAEISYDPGDLNLSGQPVNKYGRLRIKSVELIMPEHTSGNDLAPTPLGGAIYPAMVLVHSQVELSPNHFVPNEIIKNRVSLLINTAPNGVSTVVECRKDSLTPQKVFYRKFSQADLPAAAAGILLEENTGSDLDRKKFYFCGFNRHYHYPDRKSWAQNLKALPSEYRCRLEPTGTGPLYEWTFYLNSNNGETDCEIVCL